VVVIMSAHLDDDPYGGMATLKEFHDSIRERRQFSWSILLKQ